MERVVLAMSGGVDSSVAAALLVDQLPVAEILLRALVHDEALLHDAADLRVVLGAQFLLVLGVE